MAKPKGEFIVNSLPELTDDEIVRCIFGMSLKDLVRDIRENKDGKYDNLYYQNA